MNELWPIVTAVVVGNAASFAFFMAALQCSKMQKNGTQSDNLPLWVYAGLLAGPAALLTGMSYL